MNRRILQRKPGGGRRKSKKTMIDIEKVIPSAAFKAQLNDTSDIIGKFELAPPTKRAMYHVNFTGVGKYFAYPGRQIPSPRLLQLFFRSLTLKTEVQPEPRVDAQGLLEPLDPELRIDNTSNIYYTDSCAENATYSGAKRKAETFDKLVQGMCKSRRGGRRALKRPFSPAFVKSEFIEPLTPELEPESEEKNFKTADEIEWRLKGEVTEEETDKVEEEEIKEQVESQELEETEILSIEQQTEELEGTIVKHEGMEKVQEEIVGIENPDEFGDNILKIENSRELREGENLEIEELVDQLVEETEESEEFTESEIVEIEEPDENFSENTSGIVKLEEALGVRGFTEANGQIMAIVQSGEVGQYLVQVGDILGALQGRNLTTDSEVQIDDQEIDTIPENGLSIVSEEGEVNPRHLCFSTTPYTGESNNQLPNITYIYTNPNDPEPPGPKYYIYL